MKTVGGMLYGSGVVIMYMGTSLPVNTLQAIIGFVMIGIGCVMFIGGK